MDNVAVGVFVVALGVALFRLLPSRNELEELNSTGQPSALSLQHLHALVAANPNDGRLRLLFARDLLASGDLVGAEESLSHIVDEKGPTFHEAKTLHMSIALLRFRANDADVTEDVGERAIRDVLEGPREKETLTEAAMFALEIRRPALAADIYERLARQDAPAQAAWLAQAARWRRASGDEARAADLYAQAADATPEASVMRDRAVLAVDSAEASGNPVLARTLAEHFLTTLPADPELLRRAVRLSAVTGNAESARQAGRALVDLPDQKDPHLLDEQVDRELGGGDLGAARRLLKQRIALSRNDLGAHERLAKVTEATGDRMRAYAEYRWLVDQGHEAYLDRAIALAKATYQAQAVLELRLLCAKRPDPTDSCIVDLAQAYEDVGDPVAASTVLFAHVKRHGSRALWKKLAIVDEHRGAPEEAIKAWQQVASYAPLDGTEAQLAAGLQWRMDAPREAFDTLVSVPEDAPGRDVAYWSMIADLAWEINDAPVALHALAELRARGDEGDSIFDRIISIEENRGNDSGAATAALEAYRLRSEPKMLFTAVALLDRGKKNREVVTVLASATSRDPKLLELPEYWTRRAVALSHLGEKEEACRAYAGALHLEPDNSDNMRAVLECAMDRRDQKAIARYVARWSRHIDEKPELYPTYAQALLRLRRDREALDVMRRYPAKPDDYAWRMEVADAAEQLGDAAEALRLRREALDILAPRMVEAIKAPSGNRQARGAILARAILARRLEGPAAAYPWLNSLIPAGDGPIDDSDVAMLAISYYLADGNAKLAKQTLTRAKGLTPETVRNTRLALAMMANDIDEIERLLPEIPASDGSRIDALIRTGRNTEAMAAIDTELQSANATTERDRIRELRLDRADLAEQTSPSGRASYGLDALGSLLVHGPRLEVAMPYYRVRFEGDARWNQISSNVASLPIGSFDEKQGSLAFGYRTLRTNSRLALGANSRRGIAMPQASASFMLQGRLSLRLEGLFQDAPIDTPVIRAVGVRDAGNVELGLDVTSRDRIELEGMVFQERTIHQDALDIGARGSLTIAHRLLDGAPSWNVYATGIVMGRKLSSGAGASLAGVGIPGSISPNDLLPEMAVIAAIGTQFEHGDPMNPWGRTSFPRYSIGIGAGRRWPDDMWNFEARAGVGTRVFGDDVFSLAAYYGRGLIGSGADAFRGGGVYYSHGF